MSIKVCDKCKNEYESEKGHKCKEDTIASDAAWVQCRSMCATPGFSRRGETIFHCGQEARIERGGMTGVHAHCVVCGAWEYTLNIRGK